MIQLEFDISFSGAMIISETQTNQEIADMLAELLAPRLMLEKAGQAMDRLTITEKKIQWAKTGVVQPAPITPPTP